MKDKIFHIFFIVFGLTVWIPAAFVWFDKGEVQLGLAERSVEVRKNTDTKLIIDSLAIPNNEVIDLRLAMSETEKSQVKQGIILTEDEERVLDRVLDNLPIYYKDRLHFVSALEKLYADLSFSSDEQKYLAGMKGEDKEATDRVKYLGKKKVKENE
jgi:hypothetical protein